MSLATGAGHMSEFLVFPQSVTVQTKNDDSEEAILRVVERAVDAVDTRIFEFCMTREDLQRLREDITTALSEEHVPE
jgi:hypothetical protein